MWLISLFLNLHQLYGLYPFLLIRSNEIMREKHSCEQPATKLSASGKKIFMIFRYSKKKSEKLRAAWASVFGFARTRWHALSLNCVNCSHAKRMRRIYLRMITGSVDRKRFSATSGDSAFLSFQRSITLTHTPVLDMQVYEAMPIFFGSSMGFVTSFHSRLHGVEFAESHFLHLIQFCSIC